MLISDQTPWSGVADAGVWVYELYNEQGFIKTLNNLVEMDASEYDVSLINVEIMCWAN